MELEEKTKERERTEQSERGRKEEEETSLEEVHLKKKLKQTALEGTTEWELKNQFSLNSIGLSQATFHLFWNSKFTFPLSLIKIPGPLCTASISFVTEAENNKGLPHCLEHLVFLGSKDIPYRGYLDIVAARCISPGTNAYTVADHTTYELICAGSQGMIKILPIFLNFILHPTLTDSNFVTEVYHIDGSGKEQGVVFCEMLGRENTEEDRASLHFRSAMYPNTGYSVEFGGLTHEIATLTNKEVRDYHSLFYQSCNMKIILQGELDENQIFECLRNVDFTTESTLTPNPWIKPILPLKESIFEIVSFPSQDESIASIIFGWRGPKINESYTCLALDVLFRYLNDTSASPLYQTFVEIENPYATGISFDINFHQVMSLELTFSGVPTKRKINSKNNQINGQEGSEDESEEDEEDENEEEEEEMEESEEEEEEMEEHEKDSSNIQDLINTSVLKDELLQFFRSIREKGLPRMTKYIQRHKIKFLEDLEDDPLQMIEDLILYDLIFSRNDLANIGSNFQLLNMLNRLEKEEDSFWIHLLDYWILSAPIVEIRTKPDKILANTLSKEKLQKDEERFSTLGPEGLKKCAKILSESQKENSKPLPEELKKTFPSVPSSNTIPRLSFSFKIIRQTDTGFPIELVSTNTNFYHCRICFDISQLPQDLRMHLVLFQEILLETALELPRPKSEPILIPYQEVVSKLNEDLVSIMCAVGRNNQGFSCDSLSEVFFLYAVAEPTKISLLFQWIVDILFCTVFPLQRIKIAINNLLSYLTEESRDGSTICSALAGRCMTKPNSNDLAISFFKQKVFLQKLKKELNDPEKVKEIQENLHSLRKYLLKEASRIFVQLGTPLNDNGENLSLQFIKVWIDRLQSCNFSKKTRQKKKKNLNSDSNFVFKFEWNDTKLKPELSTLCPIAGVESTFLKQLVSCNITKKHPDYYPILVYAELLSTTEGPLWNEIRGKGYTYDARVGFDLFSGTLYFSLYESSSPDKSLGIFYSILKRTTRQTITDFAVESAKASLLFNFHQARATPALIISNALQSLFLGFNSPSEEYTYIEKLEKVDADDVFRVHQQYFLAFLKNEKRCTVLTCNKSQHKTLLESFKKMNVQISTQTLFDIINPLQKQKQFKKGKK